MCPLGIPPPWPQLAQGWASDISQDNQQPSLECLENKIKERISLFWWEQQDLNTGSMGQPGSQDMEGDSLQGREGCSLGEDEVLVEFESLFLLSWRINSTLILL